MRFYASSSQRQRSKAFDRIQSGAIERIDKFPYYDYFLGNYRGILRSAIENSFVPNVRNGRTALPRGEHGSNNIALLPIDMRRQDDLNIDESLAMPTPAKLSQARARVVGGGLLTIVPRDTILFKASHGGLTLRPEYGDGLNLRVFGRPIICMRQLWELDPDIESYATTHEFTHAVDSETWKFPGTDSLPDEIVRASFELHAYAVGQSFQPYLGTIDTEPLDACRDIWEANNFSHDVIPQLSSDIIQRLKTLDLF